MQALFRYVPNDQHQSYSLLRTSISQMPLIKSCMRSIVRASIAASMLLPLPYMSAIPQQQYSIFSQQESAHAAESLLRSPMKGFQTKSGLIYFHFAIFF